MQEICIKLINNNWKTYSDNCTRTTEGKNIKEKKIIETRVPVVTILS